MILAKFGRRNVRSAPFAHIDGLIPSPLDDFFLPVELQGCRADNQARETLDRIDVSNRLNRLTKTLVICKQNVTPMGMEPVHAFKLIRSQHGLGIQLLFHKFFGLAMCILLNVSIERKAPFFQLLLIEVIYWSSPILAIGIPTLTGECLYLIHRVVGKREADTKSLRIMQGYDFTFHV